MRRLLSLAALAFSVGSTFGQGICREYSADGVREVDCVEAPPPPPERSGYLLEVHDGQRSITGRVYDSWGSPLWGADVFARGDSTFHAQVDSTGYFELFIPSRFPIAELEFLLVGFRPMLIEELPLRDSLAVQVWMRFGHVLDDHDWVPVRVIEPSPPKTLPLRKHRQ
ncbi:MAG: carboxypeptidase regulatory-like domain-containing protein [Rhodothermales bacterium]|nr:carboxypeptidase regulatory-like domain-containing protein [Rhodothermales bacterium]MBO6778277.1 carboxypeptidase regulatory-like domain-containing protein [Rhodothermales bacterium]